MKITEPTSQDEYVKTLAALDHNRIEAERTARQTAADLRDAKHALAVAVSKYENETPRPTQRDLIAEVNATAKAQAEGRLSGPPQDVPGPSAIDRVAFYSREQGRGAGGGYAFRRGNTNRQQPRSMSSSPPQPMGGGGPVIRGGYVK